VGRSAVSGLLANRFAVLPQTGLGVHLLALQRRRFQVALQRPSGQPGGDAGVLDVAAMHQRNRNS